MLANIPFALILSGLAGALSVLLGLPRQWKPYLVAAATTLGLYYPAFVTPPFLAKKASLQELGMLENKFYHRKVSVSGRFRSWEGLSFNIGDSRMMSMTLYDGDYSTQVLFDARNLEQAPPTHALLKITGTIKSFGGSRPSLIGTKLEDLGVPRPRPTLDQIPSLKAALEDPEETTELMISDDDFDFIPVIPDEIGKLTNLKKLSIYNVELEEIGPWIAWLQHLEELNVGSNNLRSLPNELKDLRKLKRLNLRGNRLGEVPPLLMEMRRLEDLDLSSNGIQEVPIGISALSKLKILWLQANRLKSLPEDIFLLQAEIIAGSNRLGMELNDRIEAHNKEVKLIRRNTIRVY